MVKRDVLPNSSFLINSVNETLEVQYLFSRQCSKMEKKKKRKEKKVKYINMKISNELGSKLFYGKKQSHHQQVLSHLYH